MPKPIKSKDSLIRRWRKRRNEEIATVKRALVRRRTYLRKNPPRIAAITKELRDPSLTAKQRAELQKERHVLSDQLKSIRHVIRKHRKEKNLLLRKIRHRRRVLSLKKDVRDGLTWFDGHKVPTWIVNLYLIPARKDGVHFRITSGVRTCSEAWYFWNNASRLGLIHYVSVAYPCSSNHCGYVFPKGAIDSFPWEELREWLHHHQVPGHELRSYRDVVGTKDNVHFSHTGH